MASITSLSNSSYSNSIYGSRNVLSGLASGMDTETMIENAVSGIKMRIQNLVKKRTKVEWQQEAYRSIIDKAVGLNTKYTSYTSKTNLLSPSFFSNAVNTTTNGKYADKISATGKTNSDIKINGVKQLATAASYTVSGLAGDSSGEIPGITGREKFGIRDMIPVSTVSGSVSFKYGGINGSNFTISFDELENINEIEVYNDNGSVKQNPTTAEKLAQAIKNKLSDITYTYTKNGFQEVTTADKAIKVSVENGEIKFSDGLNSGNKVSIASSSGTIKNTLDIKNGDTSIAPSDDTSLVRSRYTYEYLGSKSLGVTFNGTTKSISMDDVLARVGANSGNEGFVSALNAELDKAFGEGKITAGYSSDGKLTLTPSKKGDTISLGGSAVKALGFETGDANYINTSKKITDLLGDKADSVFSQANRLRGAGGAIQRTSPNGNIYYLDLKGNRVDKDGYRVDENNKALYDFQINNAHINVTEDTTLESLISSVNSNPDAGVKLSYSKLTNQFQFTATETGANGRINLGAMGSALFGTHTDIEPVESKELLRDILGDSVPNSAYGTGAFKVTIEGKEYSVDAWKGSDAANNGTSLQMLVDRLNNNQDFKDANLKASYNENTNTIEYTKVKAADGSEEAVEHSYASGSLGEALSVIQRPANAYGTFEEGQDAILNVSVNGSDFTELTRSTNSFDLDGLTVSLKGEFGYTTNEDTGLKELDPAAKEDPVTFTSTTDTDKLVDAIREFVNDYNTLVTEIKSAYTTQPATKSDKSPYDPLTAEEEEAYSESELEAYNEKAKQGILFGDTTLSSMYSKLVNAVTPGGSDGQDLREIGIGTSYDNGLTTISLDESKLRSALESDPEKVQNVFTKTKEGGASSNGLMQTMQNTLNTYVRTAGEPKGVLITRAGSIKAPTSINNNSLQSQINGIDNQIERWENRMSDQIDRYTTQFTRLEQLIAEMNSQASAMSGLMGGNSGY